MPARYHLLLPSLILIALIGAGCSDEPDTQDKPAKAQLTNQGATPRVDLSLKPRTGRYRGACRLGFSVEGHLPSTQELELDYTVDFEDDQAILTVNRLSGEAKVKRPHVEDTYSFDSADPDSIDENQQRLRELATGVVGRQIVFNLDEGGTVSGMEGAADIVRLTTTPFLESMMILFGSDAGKFGPEVTYRLLLAGPHALMPDKPVGSGAKWRLDFHMELPLYVGDQRGQLEAVLEEATPGEAAKVRYEASAKAGRHVTTVTRVERAAYSVEGTWRIDPDTGHIVRDESTLTGEADIHNIRLDRSYTEKLTRELTISLDPMPADDDQPTQDPPPAD
jgi:hypothetical protein